MVKLFDRIENAMWEARSSMSSNRRFSIFKSHWGEFKILKYKRNWGTSYSLMIDDGDWTILNGSTLSTEKLKELILKFIHETSIERSLMIKFGFQPLSYLKYRFNEYVVEIDREYQCNYVEYVAEERDEWPLAFQRDDFRLVIFNEIHGKDKRSLYSKWGNDLVGIMKDFCSSHFLELPQKARDWMILHPNDHSWRVGF